MAELNTLLNDVHTNLETKIKELYETKLKEHMGNISFKLSDAYTKDYGKITNAVGIKLQSPFVTSEVSMNVKSDVAQTVTIKIFDIANRVVSKSTSDVKVGDNILKVYTTALPSSAYRVGLFDAKGNQLGITDFNKL
jgi:hypothetical protein